MKRKLKEFFNFTISKRRRIFEFDAKLYWIGYLYVHRCVEIKKAYTLPNIRTKREVRWFKGRTWQRGTIIVAAGTIARHEIPLNLYIGGAWSVLGNAGFVSFMTVGVHLSARDFRNRAAETLYEAFIRTGNYTFGYEWNDRVKLSARRRIAYVCRHALNNVRFTCPFYSIPT